MNTRIPPHSSVIAHAKRPYRAIELTMDNQERQVLFNGTDDNFGVELHVEDTFGPVPVVVGVNGDHHYDAIPVILTNTGDKPYMIKEGTVIGTSEIIDNRDLQSAGAKGVDKIETLQVRNVDHQNVVSAKDSGIISIGKYDIQSMEEVDRQTKGKLKSLLMDYVHVFEGRSLRSTAIGL